MSFPVEPSTQIQVIVRESKKTGCVVVGFPAKSCPEGHIQTFNYSTSSFELLEMEQWGHLQRCHTRGFALELLPVGKDVEPVEVAKDNKHFQNQRWGKL